MTEEEKEELVGESDDDVDLTEEEIEDKLGKSIDKPSLIERLDHAFDSCLPPMDIDDCLAELVREESTDSEEEPELWNISAILRSPSIRRIRVERRRRAIAWSDRFVVFVTTRATVPGRAGFGLRRDAPAFLGERERFTRLNDGGLGRLQQMAASSCRHRPGFSSLQRLRS